MFTDASLFGCQENANLNDKKPFLSLTLAKIEKIQISHVDKIWGEDHSHSLIVEW